MQYHIRACTPDDLPALRQLSRQTFCDAFAYLNTPENMEAYLNKAFNEDTLLAELMNIHSYFYFLYMQDTLCGYLKLNDWEAQTDIHDPASLEVERIYVVSGFQGSGLGGILLNKAAGMGEILHKSYLWLGVWERNQGALRFYKRNGFYETGRHDFYLGQDKQTDYILRKDL